VREELKKVKLDYSVARPVPQICDVKTEAPDRKCKQSEKILAGLLMDDNNYVKVVKESLTLEDFSDPAIRDIVRALFKCHEESKAMTPGKLVTYLSGSEAHRIIPELVDCIEPIIDKAKTFADCVLKIKQDNLREKLNRLQVEIALAQNSADEDRIAKLIAECNALLRNIKSHECQAKENQNETVKT
jgi:replicative DNA helicase